MLSFLPSALRRDLPQQDVSVLLLDGSSRLLRGVVVLCWCLSFLGKQRSAISVSSKAFIRLVNVLGALARSVQWQYLGKGAKRNLLLESILFLGKG